MILSYTSGTGTLKKSGASASLSLLTNGENVKPSSDHRSDVRIPSRVRPNARLHHRLRSRIHHHHLRPPILHTSPKRSSITHPTTLMVLSSRTARMILTIFTDIMEGMEAKLGSEGCMSWIRRYRDEMRNLCHH